MFLYSDLFDYKFHFEAVIELLRVANDVRIFPILSLNFERSPHLDKLMKALETNGYDVKIHQVKYELQKGGNEMLQVIKATP